MEGKGRGLTGGPLSLPQQGHLDPAAWGAFLIIPPWLDGGSPSPCRRVIPGGRSTFVLAHLPQAQQSPACRECRGESKNKGAGFSFCFLGDPFLAPPLG